MSHTISEEELASYVEQQRGEWMNFAIGSSPGSVKKLDFCLGHVATLYRVTFDKRDIYIGALKETAVREYNALP